MAQSGAYPVSFTVDYRDRELNRLTTAFRIINFVVGVMRWNVRVTAYGFMLSTDRYPPVQPAALRGAVR